MRHSSNLRSYSEAKVYSISRSVEKSQAAVETASKSMRAESIVRRMIARDCSTLEECVFKTVYGLDKDACLDDLAAISANNYNNAKRNPLRR